MAMVAANPGYCDALAAIGDDQLYHHSALEQDTAILGAIEAELSERWGPMTRKPVMRVWPSSNACGLSTLGTSRISGARPVQAACITSPTPPWVLAAAMGAASGIHWWRLTARSISTLAVPRRYWTT